MKKETTYNPENATRRVRWHRAKLVAAAAAGAACVLVAAGRWSADGLGFSRLRSLEEDNRALSERFARLTEQVEAAEGALGKIHRQGNELRLLVDLPGLDPETRDAGGGGAVESFTGSVTSDDVSDLLRRASGSVERLEREVRVQSQSYEEIGRTVESNRAFYASMPALKPMEGTYSANGFGVRMHPILGILKSHEGLDIINDVGTPVFASGDGTVSFAGHSGGGYGNQILIDHGFGFETMYAHLSSVLVKEGQKVHRGDRIGKSGKSGLASGPHLHYEVRRYGVRLDPVDFFLDDVSPSGYRRELADR